jgi:hypothetical protein
VAFELEVRVALSYYYTECLACQVLPYFKFSLLGQAQDLCYLVYLGSDHIWLWPECLVLSAFGVHISHDSYACRPPPQRGKLIYCYKVGSQSHRLPSSISVRLNLIHLVTGEILIMLFSPLASIKALINTLLHH